MTIQKTNNQETIISGTWNSAASAYNGLIIDIVDLTSNANSDLLDLRIGGVTKTNITKTGALNTNTVYADTVSATNYSNLGPAVSSYVAGYNFESSYGKFYAIMRGLTYP